MSNIVDTSHFWPFNLNWSIQIKNHTLNYTKHFPGAPQSHLASGYHVDQPEYRTLPSLHKFLCKKKEQKIKEIPTYLQSLRYVKYKSMNNTVWDNIMEPMSLLEKNAYVNSRRREISKC